MNSENAGVYLNSSRTYQHRIQLYFGIVGTLIFWITYFIFSLASFGYDYIRQPINELQWLPNGWIQPANFILFGLFTCLFSAGLRKELISGKGYTLLPLLHWVFGLSLIACGLLSKGQFSNIIKPALFLSLIFSLLLFAYRFAGDTRWKGWAVVTVVCAGLIFIFLILIFLNGGTGRYAGFFDRAIYFTRAIWYIVFIMRLMMGYRLTPIA
ncbi:hypothetical protein BH09BAC6_BH09BAC6_04050 [soil metagenome]